MWLYSQLAAVPVGAVLHCGDQSQSAMLLILNIRSRKIVQPLYDKRSEQLRRSAHMILYGCI